MISIKNPSQIAKMREAGALLHEVLTQLRTRVEPGVTTKELDHFAEQLIRRHGAIPSFLHYEGYPASICTSIDEQVVHGIPGNTVLQEGSILSIDGGLILDGWQADSAFTVGVGAISPEAQRLIEVTEQSFFEGIAMAREGNRISDIGHAVQAYVEAHGFSAVRALCGHGIGRDMHEDPNVPNFGRKHTGVHLEPGMVLAIEPMVNLGTYKTRQMSDGWLVCTRDGRPSAHFEKTVAVTEDGPIILTTEEGHRRPV